MDNDSIDDASDNQKISSNDSKDNSNIKENIKGDENDKSSLISKSKKSANSELIDSNPDENVNDIISEFLKIKKCSVILYGI